jgi:hypothetical protein
MDEPLISHVLLLPLNYNPLSGEAGRGPPVPQEIIDEMLTEIYVLAGGYSHAGVVQGAYRMANGARQDDDSLQIWIWVCEKDIPSLRQLVAKFGKMLGQGQMYLERITGTRLDLIPPLD